MKKSGKIILLFFSVIVVWGGIGYKIYTGMRSSDYPKKDFLLSNEIEKYSGDSIKLLLDYPDPFLKELRPVSIFRKQSNDPVGKNVIVSHERETRSIVNWNKIRLLGVLFGSTRKDIYAVFEIDKIEFIAQEGNSVEGFLIKKLYKDSAVVYFENQFRILKKGTQ